MYGISGIIKLRKTVCDKNGNRKGVCVLGSNGNYFRRIKETINLKRRNK